MLATLFRSALRDLRLHKLRSFLTILGTILGVASVISMQAVGEGSKEQAVSQIRGLGAANVIIRSVKPGGNKESENAASEGGSEQRVSAILEYGLKYRDLELLKATLPTITNAVPIALVRRNAQQGRHRIANARILGTTPSYLEVKNLTLQRGRFLTDVDLRKIDNVAVLGDGAAHRLFGFEDPLNQTVLLGPGAYRVVGILESQASGNAIPGALQQADFNDDIYIPITAAHRRFGELQMIVRAGSREFERTQLSEITLVTHDEQLVTQTAAMARKLLRRNHPRADDFEIKVPLELLRQAESEKQIWNLVLSSIAGISLLVGGVGIMNIMLATVTERTREIGIRRALGARRSDITAQFLTETVVLSASGGLIGIIAGISLGLIVTSTSEIETVFRFWVIVLAFGISVGIGVIFGLYPARRAALLDPIDALRHE